MKPRSWSVGIVIAIALLWLIARVCLDPSTKQAEVPFHTDPTSEGVTAAPAPRRPPVQVGSESRDTQGLPAEARKTIALIQRGGPYPHRQDGTIFGNRERLLPSKPRGYYREYTVETPGLRHRGARRIVTGGQPPDVWYYTGDHYQSFRKFTP